MNSWSQFFREFKISAALDRGPKRTTDFKGSQSARTSSEPAERLVTVHHSLVATRPMAEAPAGLHDSIMRSVNRAALSRSAPAPARLPFAWVGGSAAALVFIVALWLVPRPIATPGLDVTAHGQFHNAAAVLDAANNLQQVLPAATLDPITLELDRLSRDLTNATDLLLATLP
jgi:hypothetical protein